MGVRELHQHAGEYYNEAMKPEWLLRFTNREQLAFLFADMLVLAMLMLVDGWILVLVSRRIGVFASLAAHGAVAIVAAVVLGNSIHHQLSRIRREAREGRFRPRHYARLLAVVIAAILLIIPGSASGALGLILYLPPGRHIFGWLFVRRYRDTLAVVYEYFKLGVFSDDDAERSDGSGVRES